MSRLASVAVVKNEELDIAEWIAFQLVIGFDTVILYDNASTDDTAGRARAFSQAYDVRVIDWPETGANYQLCAYENAVREFGREFTWMAFFDTDEFLALAEGFDLRGLLSLWEKGDTAAVAVPWAMFGSSGHVERPDGLVIEAFTKRAPDEFGSNRHVKSIIRPEKMTACRNPHLFHVNGTYRSLSGVPLAFEANTLLVGKPDYSMGKLHHYFTRSRAHWAAKMARGYRDRKREYTHFDLTDQNDVLDNRLSEKAEAVINVMNSVNSYENRDVMNRQQKILCHIAPGTRGIEVAPWHKPVIPRGAGREVVVLDYFDRPTLLARAEKNHNISAEARSRIDEVDLVGSACDIADLSFAKFGSNVKFDFVVSSHNFEHLPDPIRFLRGCEAILTDGGVLSMAVPDKRACFDYFRPHSSTSEMLQAFHENRDRPSLAQVFNQGAYRAGLMTNNGLSGIFTVHERPDDVKLVGNLKENYSIWLKRLHENDHEYHDTHCWTFTPSSFELIISELIIIGLINFEIMAVYDPAGSEFIVNLRKCDPNPVVPVYLSGRRGLLLKRINDELAYTSMLERGVRAGGEEMCRKGFMVHVPKTAGQTINHLMTESLGREHVLTHIEGKPAVLENIGKLPGKIEFVSGHLRLPVVLRKINRDEWFIFLMLRNPVDHLISHLKWVKALAAPERASELSGYSTEIQDIATRLGAIGLNDVSSLENLIKDGPQTARNLFDNCQIRYLVEPRDEMIGAADVDEAVESLRNCDHVGFSDSVATTIDVINKSMNINVDYRRVPRINPARISETVALDDPEVLDFYRNAVRWDAALYQKAKETFGASAG